jgi:hypothetical protein
MPVEVIGESGSIVLGNPDLPSILVYNYKGVSGTVETTDPSYSLDIYSIRAKMHFTKPQVRIRSNVDYREPNIADIITNYKQSQNTWKAKLRRFFRTSTMEEEIPLVNRQWDGLARYKVFQKQNEEERTYPEEYAKVTNILVAKGMDLTYISDSPGTTGHIKI